MGLPLHRNSDDQEFVYHEKVTPSPAMQTGDNPARHFMMQPLGLTILASRCGYPYASIVKAPGECLSG
jgi:hypothetical protein